MAIAFQAANSNNASFSSSVTVSLDVGSAANRVVLALAGVYDNTSSCTVTGITYNGVSMTFVGNVTLSSRTHALYVIATSATGTNNVVASFSSGSFGVYCVAASYSGVDQTTPIRSGSFTGYGEISGSTTPSRTVSSATNDVVVGMMLVTSGSAVSLTAASPANGRLTASGYRHAMDEAGASSVTIDGTYSASSNFTMAAASLQPAAASSPPVITAHPSGPSVTEPATANFTATATGSTSLQWQYSSDGGTTPNNVSDGTGGTTGTTSGSYTTSATAVSSGNHRNGYLYRCGFTNGDGTTYTNWATLTVNDGTAPVLSSPTGVKTSHTTATIGATTDEGNGTLYGIVTTSATQPSVAQIKAGQDHTGASAAWGGTQAISTTGAKTLNAAGLTPSTVYYGHLVHTDAAANDSNRVSSSSFTTDAAPSSGALSIITRLYRG